MQRTPHSLRLLTLAGAILLTALFAACINDSEGSGTNDPVAGADTTLSNTTWWTNAAAFRGEIDLRVAYVCPDSGTAGVLWGTDIYTDDSSVCTAAVHAGKITFAAGGTIIIRIRPGEESYEASERNGVSSSSWPSWSGSFVFP